MGGSQTTPFAISLHAFTVIYTPIEDPVIKTNPEDETADT